MSIQPIQFVDHDSGDEALVLIRVIGDWVGLSLSLQKNGDIEVVFGSSDLDRIIGALETARSTLQSKGMEPAS